MKNDGFDSAYREFDRLRDEIHCGPVPRTDTELDFMQYESGLEEGSKEEKTWFRADYSKKSRIVKMWRDEYERRGKELALLETGDDDDLPF